MKNTLPKLAYEILKIANRELPRSVFLKEVSNLLIDTLIFSELKILQKIPKSESQYELVNCTTNLFDYNIINGVELSQHLGNEGCASLWKSILEDKFDSSSTYFSENGSFWTINFNNISIPYQVQLDTTASQNEDGEQSNYSLLIIPFIYNSQRVGLIQIKNLDPKLFSNLGTNQFEDFAQTLSVILTNQYTQALLQERVKELALMYKMSNITKQKSISFENIIQDIIKLIPPAWQYPELTRARVSVNGVNYSDGPINECEHKLVSDIIVNNKKCGFIEVIYTEKCPNLDEGPFFNEERRLLDNISEELSTIISAQNNILI
ncbi:hypothetical protein [Ancylomarina sp. 16SWW S1-10-2]|uniref:hypothetical protein n=1 Tax=Ancylomarina sp. 16SWW S1-10-2 TaxID=2499681 RepID=UPI0012AE2488|nr:hypothetical protein [Ancylomarina sp. 16SWW S1-10-2]MRT91883.1 hypothetical protein [Ancylomarina sp. 16SWW S1-10-2]